MHENLSDVKNQQKAGNLKRAVVLHRCKPCGITAFCDTSSSLFHVKMEAIRVLCFMVCFALVWLMQPAMLHSLRQNLLQIVTSYRKYF